VDISASIVCPAFAGFCCVYTSLPHEINNPKTLEKVPLAQQGLLFMLRLTFPAKSLLFTALSVPLRSSSKQISQTASAPSGTPSSAAEASGDYVSLQPDSRIHLSCQDVHLGHRHLIKEARTLRCQ
jgi:hypothetical protein